MLKKDTLIVTGSGRQIDLSDMKLTDITLEDIAHSLSQICRFNGHCKVTYSVAEHCVRMAELVRRTASLDITRLLLMHDAAEAYTGDFTTPIKRMPELSNILRELDDRVTKVIFNRFNIHTTPGWIDFVHELDKSIMLVEMRDLFPWGLMNPCVPIGVKPAKMKIRPWSPRKAERKFLKMAKRLSIY